MTKTYIINLTEPSHDAKPDIICEICHTFLHQFDIAKAAANAVIEAVSKRENGTEVIFDYKGCKIKRLVIEIKYESFDRVTATLERISTDGTGYMSLNYDAMTRFGRNEQEAKQIIEKTISHELMHSNIIFNQLDNDSFKGISKPNGYDIYGRGYNFRSDFTDDYLHMIYCCFYHELQAKVSESWLELKDLFDKPISEITFSDGMEFLKYVKMTETYQEYEEVYAFCRDAIFWKKEKFEEISNDLITAGIDVTSDEVRKNIKKCLGLSEEAINRIVNSCWVLYEGQREKK